MGTEGPENSEFLALQDFYYFSLASQDPLAYFTCVELACCTPGILDPAKCLIVVCFYSERTAEGDAMLIAGTRDWQVYRAALSAWAAAMRLWSTGLRNAATAAAVLGGSNRSENDSSNSSINNRSSSEPALWLYQVSLGRIPLRVLPEVELGEQHIAACVASGSALDPLLLLSRQFQLMQLAWVARGVLLLLSEGAKHVQQRREEVGYATGGSSNSSNSNSSTSGIVADVREQGAERIQEGLNNTAGAAAAAAADTHVAKRHMMHESAEMPAIPTSRTSSSSSSSSANGSIQEPVEGEIKGTESNAPSRPDRGPGAKQQQQDALDNFVTCPLYDKPFLYATCSLLVYSLEGYLKRVGAAMQTVLTLAAASANGQVETPASAAAAGATGTSATLGAAPGAPAASGLALGAPAAAEVNAERSAGVARRIGGASCISTNDLQLLGLLATPQTVAEAAAAAGNAFNSTTVDAIASLQARAAALSMIPDAVQEVLGGLRAWRNALWGVSTGGRGTRHEIENEQQESGRELGLMQVGVHADGTGKMQATGEQSTVKEAEYKYLDAVLDSILHVLRAEVPLPVGCNHPHCPAAVDEAVATRKCTGCKLAVYCSDGCLKEHWKEHKGVCRRVQAARKELAGNGSKDV